MEMICKHAEVEYLINHQPQPVESGGSVTLKEKGCSDNISIVVLVNPQCYIEHT